MLGQIVLANFANNEGLKSEGDNVWSATQSSGVALLGTAGSGNFGTLTNGALEASNVDLSKELVNMIVAQRNYQSNAQTIKTRIRSLTRWLTCVKQLTESAMDHAIYTAMGAASQTLNQQAVTASNPANASTPVFVRSSTRCVRCR